jgi:DNA-binding transcriptional regulator YiaG
VFFSRIFTPGRFWVNLVGMDQETTKGKHVRRTRAEIDNLLESFARSGLTQQAFCRENGVSVATFSNWRRKAAAGIAAAETVLRPVRVTESSGDGPTVRLPEGVEIILPAGSAATDIAALVGALRAIGPC